MELENWTPKNEHSKFGSAHQPARSWRICCVRQFSNSIKNIYQRYLRNAKKVFYLVISNVNCYNVKRKIIKKCCFLVSAFYAEHYEKRISFCAHIWTKSKFLGLSIAVYHVGQGCISLSDYDEEYIITFPNAYGRFVYWRKWSHEIFIIILAITSLI